MNLFSSLLGAKKLAGRVCGVDSYPHLQKRYLEGKMVPNSAKSNPRIFSVSPKKRFDAIKAFAKA